MRCPQSAYRKQLPTQTSIKNIIQNRNKDMVRQKLRVIDTMLQKKNTRSFYSLRGKKSPQMEDGKEGKNEK